MSTEKEVSEINQKAREKFQAEEVKRIAAEEAGRIHNCVEAGCDIAPDGKPIVKTPKPPVI